MPSQNTKLPRTIWLDPCGLGAVFHFKARSRLLPVVALHGQDLHHTDKDVDEVQLQTDALVDYIPANKSSFGHASVVQDLLDVIKGEATEDSKTTVQPDLLGPHQSTCGSGGNNEGSQAGKGNDGHTSEERTT